MNEGSGNQVGITYNEMTATAETLRGLIGQLETTLSESRTLIESNIGNDEVWNSEAATDFKKKYVALSETFPDFKQELIKCATFLDETVVKAYQQAEKNIQASAAENLTTGYSGEAQQ